MILTAGYGLDVLAVAMIYRCLDGQLGPAPMEISTVDRP
jgi:hypothetical protein